MNQTQANLMSIISCLGIHMTAKQNQDLSDAIAEIESLQEQIDKYKLRAQINEGMADCMDMLRRDMIKHGIIDESVPPMFMSEAILSYIINTREKISG